jgi:hypothetical protein
VRRLQGWRRRFLAWWHAPVRTSDRVLGAVVGGWGAALMGFIGTVVVGSSPFSLSTLGWSVLGSALTGVVIGMLWPKLTTAVLFPFTTLGGGS